MLYPYIVFGIILFYVVETHINGVEPAHQVVEAAVPIPARLTIKDWHKGNSAHRALRVGTLLHPAANYHTGLLLPISDPVMVRMTDDGFLLVGWQIETLPDNRTAEHSKGWWVKVDDECR